MNEVITINLREYEQLKYDALFLQKLEELGIDSLDIYSEAHKQVESEFNNEKTE
jgi:hypothetical protein